MNFTTRIHAAASGDQTRPLLTTVYVRGGVAYATDSYVAARSPVANADGIDQTVPSDAVKQAWRNTGRETVSHPVTTDGNGKVTVLGKTAASTYDNVQLGKFPDIDALIDGRRDVLERSATAFTFAVDTARLLQAAEAICEGAKNHNVRITVDPASSLSPLLVQPLALKSKAVAIVMPLRIGGA